MFARLILSCLTSVGLFAAAFAQAPAPSQEKHKHHAKMVLRVYQIADLIEGPYLTTNEAVVKAFRPKSG